MQGITSSELARYREEREKILRGHEYSAVVVDEVLRYGAHVGCSVEWHEQLERAMDHGKSLIRQAESKNTAIANGTVILAEKLSRSRGRFDRSWYAPAGGLWGCLVLANTFLPQTRLLLPLTVGVACCEAVREMGVESCTVRWVNDVLVDEVKLAGFLLEGHTSQQHLTDYFLVGFGINLNNKSFPDELKNIAVSLSEILGSEVDIRRFTLSFLAKLSWNIGLLHYEEALRQRSSDVSVKEGKHLLLQKWEELTDCIGRRVKYGLNVIEYPQYEATVTSIHDGGGLVMRFDDGREIIEHSGEIRYLD